MLSLLKGSQSDLIAEVIADCLELARRTSPADVSEKGPYDFVTNLDFKLDALLKNRLSQIVDLPVISEEDERQDYGLEGSYWMIDPLDGTNNFQAGLRDIATSVGLVIDNSIYFGMLVSHERQAAFSAQIGQGLRKMSFAEESETTISGNRETNLIGLSSGFLRWWTSQDGDIWKSWHDLCLRSNFRNLGSQVMHAWHVAEGTFEASFSAESHIWDDVAARLIVEEAGGNWLSVRPLLKAEGEPIASSRSSTCFFSKHASDYAISFREQLIRRIRQQEMSKP